MAQNPRSRIHVSLSMRFPRAAHLGLWGEHIDGGFVCEAQGDAAGIGDAGLQMVRAPDHQVDCICGAVEHVPLLRLLAQSQTHPRPRQRIQGRISGTVVEFLTHDSVRMAVRLPRTMHCPI